jgi:hypothetical protein
MKRAFLAAPLALVMGGGTAGATVCTIDVPIEVHRGGSHDVLQAFGHASFPDLTLHFGDIANFTVEFGKELIVDHPHFLADSFHSDGQLIVSQLPLGNGFVHFVYDSLFYLSDPDIGNSFNVSAGFIGTPNSDISLTLNGLSFEVTAVPEPAPWMLLGLAFLGIFMFKGCPLRDHP